MADDGSASDVKIIKDWGRLDSQSIVKPISTQRTNNTSYVGVSSKIFRVRDDNSRGG